MYSFLTSDKLQLSEPKNGFEIQEIRDADDLDKSVLEYVRTSLAENTKTAYRADLQRFLNWGGTIPAPDKVIATYLAEHASTHSVATLTRWIASISVAHTSRSIPSPTGSALVRTTLKGIKRVHGRPQKRTKPLLIEDLIQVLSVMGNTPKDIRDRALLLIGFAGGFRRSELVALDIADVESVRQGIIITIRRSKIDQSGDGRKIGIPFGRRKHCPVKCLEDWIEYADLQEGALFRPTNRHGLISRKRLSADAVALTVKERVSLIGLPPDQYSGHSLRSGLATSAAMAGVSSWKIRQQTGHASEATLNRYVRDGELFSGNAAGVLL
jgi:integrase